MIKNCTALLGWMFIGFQFRMEYLAEKMKGERQWNSGIETAASWKWEVCGIGWDFSTTLLWNDMDGKESTRTANHGWHANDERMMNGMMRGQERFAQEGTHRSEAYIRSSAAYSELWSGNFLHLAIFLLS